VVDLIFVVVVVIKIYAMIIMNIRINIVGVICLVDVDRDIVVLVEVIVVY
jgi:hypothetical protein